MAKFSLFIKKLDENIKRDNVQIHK
uniref:Uncharacterized protein n=1 Tax=Rhizophora mucronata TaxID=61149 RepID=A0A2P2NSN6_RHIMU